MSDSRTASVLNHLLGVYPAPLTIDEVVRELTRASDDFEACAAVEAALRELLATGLLHRHGAFVLPTRAAVRFNDLTEDRR